MQLAKKIVFIIALVLTLSSVQVSAATGLGFSDVGGYTNTENEYTFLSDDTVLLYYKETEPYPDYGEIWSGSYLFVPIGMWDATAKQEIIATDKFIKNDNVEISYKILAGKDCIEEITIVDGKKLKLADIPAGSYARISLSSNYPLVRKTRVSIRLVLSVNRVSYQETRTTLNLDLQNRIQVIDKNSVYGAQIPTQFNVTRSFNGNVSFDFGDNIKYHTRVEPNKKYALNLDRQVVPNLAAMYKDAYLEYYNFKGNYDTFAVSGSLEIPIDRKKFTDKSGKTQLYAYRVVENQLQSMDLTTLSFDQSRNLLKIKTKTLSQYVISNRALMKTVEDNMSDIIKYGYAEPSSSSSSASSK